MREKDDLDLLLDSALASYADPGPDAGLERRTLARVAAEPATAPRRRGLLWGFGLTIATCLLLLIFFWPRIGNPHADQQARRPQKPAVMTARNEPATAPRSAPDLTADAQTHRSHLRSTVIAAKAGALPKLDIFPTPVPLTPQEQALVDFATHAPAQERQALLDAQKQMDKPLTIAAIRIPPLEPPDKGEN
jgi:hypothetical protein